MGLLCVMSSDGAVAVNRCDRLPNGGAFNMSDGDALCVVGMGGFGSDIGDNFADELDAVRRFSAILSILRMSAILVFLIGLSIFNRFFLLPFSSTFDAAAAAFSLIFCSNCCWFSRH